MAIDISGSWEIYNEESVRRMQEEDPDILPTYTVNSSKDLAYNKKQINSAITSAIIQGKSIDGIADDLQNRISTLNKNSAVKTARTAITSAQNGGKLSSLYELRDMGVDVKKEWVATLDSRTRPSHAVLDGQRRELEEAFSNGLQYPGASGSAAERYNCRCTMVSYIPDIDTSDAVRWSRNPTTNNREYVPNITYSEWKKLKTATIRSPINQRNTSRGKASAVTHYDVELNTRQEKLLENLPEYDSKVTVKKSEVSMSDLSALTAKTGVEFALFTKEGERLIIRGDSASVNITPEIASQLAEQGYRWSGHTHPGTDTNTLMASQGDYLILEMFNQRQSVIYNSLGEHQTFEKD